MNTTIIINKDFKVEVDLSKPIDISIPLREGENNPNCYWADPVKMEVIKSGDFVGSVGAGGSVNYQKLTITPHGNGTHTECYGHLTSDGATINSCLHQFHFLCQLISVVPELSPDGDHIIQPKALSDKIGKWPIDALIVRTLPNNESKLTRQYSGQNPPYFDKEFMSELVNNKIEHLLVDLPSVDKEVDGGILAAHKSFWRFDEEIRKEATITELVFVENEIKDGLYLMNLQIMSLNMDAAPSKPIIYPILSFS